MGATMKNYISVDIGGTEIKYGLLAENGAFLKTAGTPTEAEKGGSYLMETTGRIVGSLLQTDTAGICISTAGMVDSELGKILFANSNIPGYTGTEIKKRMEEAFHIPCEVENDVYCAGIAEYFSGAASGSSQALCLTVGTGIGGCVMVNGRILHGVSYSAGSVGYMHMPDGRTFEEAGSVTALVRRVAERKKENPNRWNGRKIFDCIAKQDEICIRAVDEMTDILGLGIANACYLFNPEVVVLGGGIMRQEAYLLPRIRASLERCLVPAVSLKTKLRAAMHHNKAGMLGAFYHFRGKQNGGEQ